MISKTCPICNANMIIGCSKHYDRWGYCSCKIYGKLCCEKDCGYEVELPSFIARKDGYDFILEYRKEGPRIFVYKENKSIFGAGPDIEEIFFVEINFFDISEEFFIDKIDNLAELAIFQ
jgi:hypothetical protein